MNTGNDTYLDNPVWYSLCQVHKNFAVDYPGIKFYHPDYCPFGGFERTDGTSKYIEAYSALVHNFFVVGEKPVIPATLYLQKELVCLQLIIGNRINTAITEDIIKLTDVHTAALYDLVTLVQPGYFKTKTTLLGNYFGIFKDGKLVAAAGERMKMTDYVEVSAVVTHPNYTGNGYAKQLTGFTVNTIFNQFKMPYLHVAATNIAAIALYEKLGFTPRRKISFWNIVR